MKKSSAGFIAATRHRADVPEFLGVDLQNSTAAVSFRRSPDAPNMVRDVPGKVRKRMGYRQVSAYPSQVRGVFELRVGDTLCRLVHAGCGLFKEDAATPLVSDMKDAPSSGFQVGEKLYIADGGKLRVFDGESVATLSDLAYVPTLVISRDPAGGGTEHEPLNLLSPYWTESFLADGTSTVYQLSYTDLDSGDGSLSVKKLVSGVWQQLSEGTDYTAERALGTVNFASAPAAPATSGEDNVRITAKKTRAELTARIDGCDIGVLYGVNGAPDRLFLSGNPVYPNLDWYSALNDPSYFAETDFTALGQDSCAVAGYSIIDNKLAAHKLRDDDARNIVIREGKMVDGEPAFPIVNSLVGEPAVSRRAFATANGEPLFLSARGVCAVTAMDVTGTWYAQNRSYYVNAALCGETLGAAVACCFNDFYIIAVGGKLYLLDTLVKEYQKDSPYSSYQYECYVFTGIDARQLWVRGGALRFATSDGAVMEFYSDPAQRSSYNDNGQAIECWWTLPDFSGDTFYLNKSFQSIAVRLAAAGRTSVKISALVRGAWQTVAERSAAARFLKFSELQFSQLSFKCDNTPRTVFAKLRIKRVPSMRFRVGNDRLNEPFGIFELGLEYENKGYSRR